MNHTPLYTNNVMLTLQQVLETLNVDKFFYINRRKHTTTLLPHFEQNTYIAGGKTHCGET